MPIYCDESGYTGINLLTEQQPYFVYAALNITESDASEFQQHLLCTYRLQGTELKGTNLLGSNSGRRAILELFAKYSGQVKMSYYHKKYALACKFFEYIFEPVLAENNALFYRMKFHRFVANLIFEAFQNTLEDAGNVFLHFQELLRGNDMNGLFELFRSSAYPQDLIQYVAEFAVIHKERILDEIHFDGEVASWVLDLSQTALYDLLCKWGIGTDLSVVCDRSKPLEETVAKYADLYAVGREKLFLNPFGEGEVPLNFTLAEPLRFANSRHEPGLQLADIFASSAFWALRHSEDAFAVQILNYLEAIIRQSGNSCILPQPELYLQPSSLEFAFGVTTLQKLARFSVKDKDRVLELFITDLQRKVGAYRRSLKKGK